MATPAHARDDDRRRTVTRIADAASTSPPIRIGAHYFGGWRVPLLFSQLFQLSSCLKIGVCGVAVVVVMFSKKRN
jgi:hypothetical protein